MFRAGLELPKRVAAFFQCIYFATFKSRVSFSEPTGHPTLYDLNFEYKQLLCMRTIHFICYCYQCYMTDWGSLRFVSIVLSMYVTRYKVLIVIFIYDCVATLVEWFTSVREVPGSNLGGDRARWLALFFRKIVISLFNYIQYPVHCLHIT